MASSGPKPLPAPVITATRPSLGYSYPYPSVRRRAATERSALARYGRFLRANVAIATKSTQKLICAGLWASRPPAAVHSLFVERSTPSTRAYANNSSEDLRQVTLICEAAGQGDIPQRQSTIAQLLLCCLDAKRQKPFVRCGSDGSAKGAREAGTRSRAAHRRSPPEPWLSYLRASNALAKRDSVRLQLAYIGSLIRPSSTAST
jgi:hypothetical protein